MPDLAHVTKALAARAEHYDRTASFPAGSIGAIHDAGLLTATVHERYGGHGAGLAETAVILRALGHGDPSAALITAMTMFAHAMQGIEPMWPDDIYRAAVAEAGQRPVLINALRVEPELGTPARGGLPATVASPDGDRWSLTGHKIFSTGAEGLRWMVVWARVGDTQEARGFLVRSDSPGISIERTWDHLGLRASRSDDVLFAGTPAVPTAGSGGGPLFLAWNSLGLTSLYLGVAAAARDWLVSFLTERSPASLGRPLATLPRFQAAVGEIDASLGTAEALLDAMSARVDERDATAMAQAPAVKLTGTRAAIDAVSQAVALVGNNGLTRHNPLERHLRDVLCARVHTPQDDSIVATAGRAAFPGILPVSGGSEISTEPRSVVVVTRGLRSGWCWPMVARRMQLPATSFAEFGTLLRVLRLRARLTQRDLGIAVGYSEAQISRLEQGKRLPDPAVVAALFGPSLGLSGEPELASRLHALAQAARDARNLPRPEPADDDQRGDAAATHRDDLAAIPAAPRPCVARPATAGRLRDRLAEAHRVLVCGPPGAGKTTLAAAVAREMADGTPVCWLTLTEGITTPVEAVVRRLARFLDRHGRPEAAPLLEPGQAQQPLPADEQLHLLATALNHGEALICLDNAQLLGGEQRTRAAVEHLAASSQARFLAISREDIQLSGFDSFRLGGLDRGQARALIQRLAGGVLSGRLATRLIDRTAGNPMLIRLALGPTGPGEADPAALVERLEAQSSVSAYLLRATMAGLTEPGRLLVTLLAVFRYPVDLLDERLIEASMEVEGRYDVIGGIEELRRRQLVDHAARAALHPLVHDHVYAALAGDVGRRRDLHRLAAAHCEQVLADPLEASWHYARAGEPAEAADLLVASILDLTASGRCARAADLATELLGGGQLAEETARQLLVARGDLLAHTERAGEAEESYRDALARPAPPAVRAGVAWRLAQCMLQRGQVPEALDLCRTAATGLTGDDGLLGAHLATVQSQAHLMLSDYDQAVATATRALEFADRVAAVTAIDAAGIQCRVLGVLGVVARLRGQPDEARRMLRLSLTAGCAARRRDMVGRALFNLGACAHEHGELDRAERLYAEALAEMRPIGDGFGIARVLHSLGKIHFHRCAADEAMALFLESAALRRRLGDAQGAANSEHSYAHVLLSLGRTAEARELLATALRATAGLGERRSLGHYLDSLGMIALVDGDVTAADGYLAEAGDIAAAIDEPALRAAVGLHRALAHLARGDLAAAGRTAGPPGSGTAGAGSGGQAPEPDGSLLALERCAVIACVTLASGDRSTAAWQAAEMGRRAAVNGFALEARAARRISAAVEAAAADETDAAWYPRLIWVSDETSDLDLPVRGASLTQA